MRFDANGNPVPVTPITALSPNTNPLQCDYFTQAGTSSTAAGTLFIPNPQTGSFSTIGAFRNPWIATGNLQLSYDISPKLSATLTLANVFHSCFGGTKTPWSSVYGPSPSFCAYAKNGTYVSNFFNDTSPTELTANGTTPFPCSSNRTCRPTVLTGLCPVAVHRLLSDSGEDLSFARVLGAVQTLFLLRL